MEEEEEEEEEEEAKLKSPNRSTVEQKGSVRVQTQHSTPSETDHFDRFPLARSEDRRETSTDHHTPSRNEMKKRGKKK